MPRKSNKRKVNSSFDFILFITVLVLLALRNYNGIIC